MVRLSSVALTDKQLRIIVQRDNKRIQSDASSWRNERADFQQVVGLQSTLTLLRTQQLAQPHQPLYEPKVYKFLIQAGGQPLDSASEYAEDLVHVNQVLVKRLAELESQVKQRDDAVTATNNSMELLRRELDELRLREAGETTRGLQLKAWNLALLQEFEMLQLQQHQIRAGAPPTLVDVDLLQRLQALTAEVSYPSENDEPEPEIGGGSDGIETSSDDEDSNFNYDPTAHSDDEIGGFISTDVVASTAATKALVEDLQQLLARNQRLVQDTKLLIYAASDAPLAPDLAPPDLSANIDIHSQRQRTQELEAQNKLLQAMTAHHLNERTTFDARQRERIEMAEMATEEARMWQVRHDLVSQNLALKFKNTTLESYQEKYEECEKARKRLEVRLMAQTDGTDRTREVFSRIPKVDDDDDISQITLQCAAELDMQLNVLKELSRTQTMRIETMNDEHAKLRLDFAQHIHVMKTRVVQLEASMNRQHERIASN
ncbi:hypothetical protein DYB25_002836 [Aphanomyces astaci]|uniref:Uncharacterized protein n=2 Tax=Aphanomyces astaci TaxID=112090 RepID=A0A397AIP5_APHAT|nr:hypothetical protein DYB25_002836 [Aphanomyces astaci]